MADKHINIRLGSKFNGSGFSAAMHSLKSLTKGAQDIKAAFGMVTGAIGSAFSSIKTIIGSAFKFETQTTQFKTLIGNIDEAKAHMADLKALGDTPPFNLDQFAAASRALMVMTDGVLGYKKSLEMIGDAAAATGQPIEQMSHAVGRLFAVIRDGQPISRATMQLRNMGVITPEVAAKLDQMQKSGASAVDIWNEVEKALAKYNGAMKETESTGDGLAGAIKSRWDNIVRALGEAFSDTAKGGMAEVLDAAKRLEEDGSLDEWAENVREATDKAAGAFKTLAGKIRDFFGAGERNTQNSFMALLGGLGAGIANAGEFGGGLRGFRKAQAAYIATHAADERMASGAAGRLNKMMRENGEWAVDTDIRQAAAEADADERAERRRRREERAAKRKAEEEARAVEESNRKLAALQAADEKRAESAAAEQAAKEVEALKKTAAEIENIKREKAKIDEQIHQKRMADLRAEIELQKKAAEPLKAVASAAQSEFDRAFAMYRNPEQAAAQIAEERDYAADLKQLHKDASRYGGKWRIDDLAALMSAGDTQGVQARLEEWRKSKSFTPEVESLVRASAAEQTKTTAEDELRKLNDKTGELTTKLESLAATRDTKLDGIERNTNQLANKIDELLSVKG